MSEFFSDELPFVAPLQGAIQRFEVPAPTDAILAEHRAEVARVTGEHGVTKRYPSQGSVEAGLRESAVETFYVPPPTEEMMEAHRAEYARLAGTVGSEAVKLTKTVIIWTAVRAGLKGRVTL